MNFNGKRVLILAPHTDDGELGCGATISRAIREGATVWYVAFSKCEESLPEGLPKDTLAHEALNATKELGILNNHVDIKSYKVRYFFESRQKILEDMIRIRREINPDIVFLPSSHDIHQDHIIISQEGMRAFKKTTIMAYELPWNNFTFDNQAFVKVSEEDANKKVNALKNYNSQNGRQYINKDYIIATLRMHGVQIGEDYAEVFEIPRIII